MQFKDQLLARKQSVNLRLLVVFLLLMALWLMAAAPGSAAASYSSQLRRYPYLTDVVGSYATINWATDRTQTSGAVRFGKVGSESCTAHYVPATKTAITVNGVLEYQWKAMLDLAPGTQYCYRVYLGSSPVSEIDLLGSDSAPRFWTQVPSGATNSFSFVVFGDWGQVDTAGNNTSQANLMSLMASSGARFAMTTGDNGYPSGTQTNFGDLIQTGSNISAIFGPSFWKVPGASMPIFPSMGNHGLNSTDTNHPALLTWPEDRAVSTSNGRYTKETYCCLNGTSSASYATAWYAFDAGPARFYVLNTAWSDSNVGTTTDYKNDYDYHWAPGTAQYQWLVADLAAHPSVLKFAFFHYPLLSDNPNEATDTYLLGSASLEGLLKQNGVDIAFTGHSHIYERNLPSAAGIFNYITGGGGATIGTLGTCTTLDAYAIKFTTTGKACGSAPVPTSAAQVYHFLKVTVNGTSVTVTPINSLGQSFDARNYIFSADAETTAPTVPGNLNVSAASGTQVNLSWSASSDNSGVRGYGIYRDGVLVNTVEKNTLSYSDTNLIPSTTYTYRVDSFDGSGNHSALSTSRSATTQSTATFTFPALADSYVAADFSSTNYGLSGTLKADASPDYRSYLRFNVDDINGTVTKATLRLYTTSSSATGYQVKRVTDQAWEEGSITYASAPTVGSAIGSSGNISSGNWTTVDITSLITGNGVYDLVLTTTSSSVMNFNSRDASSNQPELVIQTGGAVTPTPTNTNTPTSTMTPTLTPTSVGTSTSTLTATPAVTAVTSPTSTLTPTISTNMPTSTATANLGSTLTFTTVADARVVESSPTTNYGTSTTLQADSGSGAAQTSYIRFNASGINGSVQNVKLRVFCTTNGTANGPAVYLADNNWIETGTGGITWSAQPALLSGAVDNQGAFGTSTWVEYNVTSLVSGNGTYTFALVADSTDGVTFSSREGTTPPQLVITTQSGLTATATITSTTTATSTPSLTATRTPTAQPTNTTTATATSTLTATTTRTLTPTNTSTATLTATSIPSASNTATSTLTLTNTPTKTPTPVLSSTPTASASPSFTPTTAAGTVTPIATGTASQTPTTTFTPTSSPTNIPASTATAGSESALTFTTIADARVAQASPTTNYGTSTNLQADGDAGIIQTSYIRFNISSVNGSIQNAKLRVFCTTNGTANGPAVYLADNNWVESGAGGVTWNTQPALLSGVVDNSGAFGTNTWVEYNVTSLVSGNGTYTFALVADSNDGVTFSSREGGTPPQLVITTQGVSTATSAPAATATFTRTSTSTPSVTLTTIPTNTPIATGTATFTTTPTAIANTLTATHTPTSTSTRTPSVTPSHTPTSTATQTPTKTPTQLITNTPTITDTLTSTPAITFTDTPTVVAATNTFTATLTRTPTSTVTQTPTLTPTLTPTDTATVSPTPTDIPVPPSSTPTATATQTSTRTPTATSTSTLTVTMTFTDTSTATLTPSSTPTVDNTATLTPTTTPTDLPTHTPTLTETPILIDPCLLTDTPTATMTATESGAATQTATATPTQAGSFNFLPDADSYVSSSCPITNYGTATILQVDNSPTVNSYLRFTVQGLNGTVTRATLRIYANSASSLGVVASTVSNNTWTESTINYENAPPIGSSLNSSGSFAAGEWVTIDVTDYISGNGTYSLALTTPGNTATNVASRESGANAPQLMIEVAP